MQQIAEWLEKLGMSEYAQRFAESDINFSILSDLTDQDLEKIGITSLGHRRQLLRAIASLDARRSRLRPLLRRRLRWRWPRRPRRPPASAGTSR